MQERITLEDFTKDEIKRAMLILIESDISHAIEFAYLLKREIKEHTHLLERMILYLEMRELEKAKEVWKDFL